MAFDALSPELFFSTMCNGQLGGALTKESGRTTYSHYTAGAPDDVSVAWLQRKRALLELLLTFELDLWSAHYVVAKGFSRGAEGLKDRARSLDMVRPSM